MVEHVPQSQTFGYAQSSATVETQQQLLHLLYYQQTPLVTDAPPTTVGQPLDRTIDLQDSKTDIIERFLGSDNQATAALESAAAMLAGETDGLLGLDKTSSMSSMSSAASSSDRQRHPVDSHFDISLEDIYPHSNHHQSSDGNRLALAPSSNCTIMGGSIEEVG